MHKLFLLLGAALSGLSVAIGAFGAHALKKLLEANQRTATFETAVQYQFYHALALLAVGLLLLYRPESYINYAGWAFVAGVAIFSGSLYALCLTNIKVLGAITPIGGVAMIAGWILLFWGIYKSL